MTAETFLNGRVTLHPGDSRDVLKTIPDCSIDSIVTDPPYALVSIVKRFGKAGSAAVKVPEDGSGAYARASAGFMGKAWDTGETAFATEFWAECLRVLKPGGHVVAFSGTRTYHRMAVAIEDAGFEVRDMLSWLYGSGFPKSHDVAKGLDRVRDDRDDILRITTAMAEAAEFVGISRSDIDAYMGTSDMGGWWTSRLRHRCACPKWDQWLQLKVLLGLGDDLDAEVWRLNGRKGMPGEAWQSAEIVGYHDKDAHAAEWRANYTGSNSDSDRAIRTANSEAAKEWQGWGTALKPACEPICFGRKPMKGTVAANVLEHGTGAINIDGCRIEAGADHASNCAREGVSGIWREHGSQPGIRTEASPLGRWPANIILDGSEEVIAAFPETTSGTFDGNRNTDKFRNTFGTFKGTPAAETPFEGSTGSAARFFYTAKADADDRLGSKHPTVKPVDLMQWLCRLVTPKNGTVLDPFAGTGTTGEAAFREGFNAVLIEREEEYQADIRRRMALCMSGPDERKRESIKAKVGDLPFEAGSLFAGLGAAE